VERLRILRQFGVLVLLLVTCLAPAMACMVQDAQMNAQERACCRMMRNQCDQMDMSASHNCCQKAPRSAQDNALDTKAVTYRPIVVAVVWLSAVEWLNLDPVVTGLVEHADYSPPESPPTSISVLRV
jgi:hypothetical protein